MKHSYVRSAIGAIAMASMLVTGTAFAATSETPAPAIAGQVAKTRPAKEFRVVGKVTSMSGSGFVMTQVGERKGQTPKTFTVNTSDATKFLKGGSAASLSDITTNQMVIVSGSYDKNTSTITASEVKIPSAQFKAKVKKEEQKQEKKELKK